MSWVMKDTEHGKCSTRTSMHSTNMRGNFPAKSFVQSKERKKKIDFPLHIENTIVAKDQQRHGVGHTGTGQQRRACLFVI